MQLVRARTLISQKTRFSRELQVYFDRIERTPQGHTIKGMYVSGIDDTLQTMGAPRLSEGRVQQFGDYPIRAFMETLLDAAVTLFPQESPSIALKRLGEHAIPTFASSIVGAVIMGTVGRNWELALKCVSRGYEVSLKPGKAVVAEIGKGRARVELRNVWNFGESYQVGVVSGLLQWCGLTGEVRPVVKSDCNVDLEIEWAEKTVNRFTKQQSLDENEGWR
jgi:uncharacterized protein (TIGR02265 family)